MIHLISECLISGNYLLGEDTIVFLDSREFVGQPCGAEKAGGEGGQVLAQALRTVALGIDRYEDQLTLVRRSPQLLIDFGQTGKGNWADFVTKGEAELQNDYLAEMVTQA